MRWRPFINYNEEYTLQHKGFNDTPACATSNFFDYMLPKFKLSNGMQAFKANQNS